MKYSLPNYGEIIEIDVLPTNHISEIIGVIYVRWDGILRSHIVSSPSHYDFIVLCVAYDNDTVSYICFKSDCKGLFLLTDLL